MFLSKKYNRLPHVLTVNLLLAQFLTGFGMILWNFAESTDVFLRKLFTFVLLFTSLNSTYVWPGLIVLCLVLMKRVDLKVYPGLLVILGWGVPALVTAVLLISGERGDYTMDPAFFYGRPQIICSTVVLALSLVLVGGALVGLSRGSWETNYQVLVPDLATEDLEPEGISPVTSPVVSPINTECHMCECARAEPMPDMIISTNMTESSTTHTGQCENTCEVSDCLLGQEEQINQVEDRQVARHALLCLLLTVSLLANLSSCLWLLANRAPGRLYLELQFFCAVVNFGQGFISFGLFGLDKHLIILPFKKRLHKLWHGKKLDVQPQNELPADVQITCLQFTKYHRDQCCQDIVRKRQCGDRTAAYTFQGSELVAWLQQSRLPGARTPRARPCSNGGRLQCGGVLQHIRPRNTDFQDNALAYLRFTADNDYAPVLRQ
ncbi:hypothetical protein CRUP_038394 [Coryphaenoides rupestris]|nr:hypothetical protein CRUP_038394 [Coryphaenoides rupestris]